MSESSDKLREMIEDVDSQLENIDDSTAQIFIQIEDLENKRDSIQNGMLNEIMIDTSSYLEINKVPDFGGIGGYITFGSNFGNTNITDWIIYDVLDTPVYVYNGVGWDDDINIINWINQWNFGYDYIHHEFGITGTYGLQDQIDQLYNALDLLITNRNKYENSKTEFEEFAT